MHYRNNADLLSSEGLEIEATSLWLLQEDHETLVLVDDDMYASHPLDLTKFEKAV